MGKKETSVELYEHDGDLGGDQGIAADDENVYI
jgi:hypothetical protein